MIKGKDAVSLAEGVVFGKNMSFINSVTLVSVTDIVTLPSSQSFEILIRGRG